MESLLDKTKQEGKRTILTGNFNLNLINNTQKAGENQCSEIALSNNLMPQITLLTNVPQKSVMLIDYILINHYECKCILCNKTSFITGHLP